MEKELPERMVGSYEIVERELVIDFAVEVQRVDLVMLNETFDGETVVAGVGAVESCGIGWREG